MSWNINLSGPSADVNAAVQQDQNLPKQLKDLVHSFATSPNCPAIELETFGHVDASFGGNVAFSMRSKNRDDPTPPPAAAAVVEPVPTGAAVSDQPSGETVTTTQGDGAGASAESAAGEPAQAAS